MFIFVMIHHFRKLSTLLIDIIVLADKVIFSIVRALARHSWVIQFDETNCRDIETEI